MQTLIAIQNLYHASNNCHRMLARKVHISVVGKKLINRPLAKPGRKAPTFIETLELSWGTWNLLSNQISKCPNFWMPVGFSAFCSSLNSRQGLQVFENRVDEYQNLCFFCLSVQVKIGESWTGQQWRSSRFKDSKTLAGFLSKRWNTVFWPMKWIDFHHRAKSNKNE